jgi:hypothetical protein
LLRSYYIRIFLYEKSLYWGGRITLCASQQHSARDIDPKLGLECFESQHLPSGTQYEGIEKLAEDVLTIRIMNGVDVVTLDCVLNPDGTLRSTGK